jgi:hypothetical protein
MTPRKLGESGLWEAVHRLRSRLQQPATDEPLISLAEVLAWCYSLEEFHAKRLSRRIYYDLRATTKEGQTQAGLMYARGLTTHSLIVAAELVMRRWS